MKQFIELHQITLSRKDVGQSPKKFNCSLTIEALNENDRESSPENLASVVSICFANEIDLSTFLDVLIIASPSHNVFGFAVENNIEKGGFCMRHSMQMYVKSDQFNSVAPESESTPPLFSQNARFGEADIQINKNDLPEGMEVVVGHVQLIGIAVSGEIDSDDVDGSVDLEELRLAMRRNSVATDLNQVISYDVCYEHIHPILRSL